MININRKGALLGFGLLGVTLLGGIAQSATAQPRYNSQRRSTVVVRERVIEQRVGRGNNRRNDRRNYTNIEGRVTADLRGNSFVLRRNNGTTQRVVVSSGEPRKLNRRDRVRAYGYTANNGVFQAQRVTVIGGR